MWISGWQPPKGKKKKGSGAEIDFDGSAEKIVDAWIARLIQRPIASERRAVLVREVGSRPNEETVRSMVNLVLSMPEYQLC